MLEAVPPSVKPALGIRTVLTPHRAEPSCSRALLDIRAASDTHLPDERVHSISLRIVPNAPASLEASPDGPTARREFGACVAPSCWPARRCPGGAPGTVVHPATVALGYRPRGGGRRPGEGRRPTLGTP